MKVLVACEESQTVCKAFRERGHEAYSVARSKTPEGLADGHGRTVGNFLKGSKSTRLSPEAGGNEFTMREFLFRGKRLDNGEWVYGYYVYAPNHLNQQEHLIQPVADDGQLAALRKVDPDTVGQFTGKFDKNGRRIFEGDICRINDMIYKVEFKYSQWAISALLKQYYRYPTFHFNCGESCEIIGNIYDNPELLEE